MATYRIFCKKSPLGPGQFLVSVAAVPEATDDRLAEITAENRVFVSADLANGEAAKMCEAMKARVVSQGHTVSSVELE
jgi:hypothetical protein